MTFGASFRVLDEILNEVLLETQTANDVARKAGAKGFTTSASAITTGGIWGNFAYLNSTQGFSLDISAGATSFPAGQQMSRYADATGLAEVRLIANIKTAGPGGGTLQVDSASMPAAASVDISSAGIKVSEWMAVSAGPDGRFLTHWFVSSPSSGSATFGLCQLQGR